MADSLSTQLCRKASMGRAAAGLACLALLPGCVLNRPTPAQAVPPLTLAPTAHFDAPEINESSGLARSPGQPGIIWTHNDSAAPPSNMLYAVDRAGRLRHDLGGAGVPTPGATNVDWEDITADDQGHLVVADLGNYLSARRDLVLYVFAEPRAGVPGPAQLLYRIPVFYPEQTAFPDSWRRYDCEAVFADGPHLYLITKNWTGANAWLYRVANAPADTPQPLERVGEFPFGAGVTAADLAPDGRLAVLTYTSVFVFTPPAGTRDWFHGEVQWRPIQKLAGGWQTEGLCWLDENTLLISAENGNLYEFPVRELRPWVRHTAGPAGRK